MVFATGKHVLLFGIAMMLMFAFAIPQSTAGQDVTALLEQGNRQSATGDIEGAFESYKHAVENDPKSVDARFKLAAMQMVRGEYRASIENYKTVISMEQNNANAFVGMGIAYLHLGSHGLARAAFEEALKLDPSKRNDIQHVIDWIDVRGGSAPSKLPEAAPHSP